MNHLTSLFFIAIALYSEVAVAATDCTAWKRDTNSKFSQARHPCYWQSLTENLTKASATGVNIETQLEATAPELLSMIRRDAKNQKILGLWGNSINFDEDLREEVVPPKILSAISRLIGNPIKGKKVNSGILSTYGHLLSNAVTPTGFKRDGWTDRSLDYGFGWKQKIISPVPQQGTLLTNVTALAGIIAFRDDPAHLKAMLDATADAATEIRDVKPETLDIRRIVETVTLTDGGKGKVRTLELSTDLVTLPFEVSPAKGLTHLLVYSVRDSASGGGAKLISAAPVTQETVDEIFTPSGLGEDQLIRTHYNAFIPELTGERKTGRRWIQVSSHGTSQPAIIINDSNWPPYFFAGASDEPPGFAKDLLQRCLPVTGWKADFQAQPISRMRKLIEHGDLDINIYSYEKSRESFLIYGKEILFTSEYRPIMRTGTNISIKKIDDFDNLRLGHFNGLSYSAEFKAYVDKRQAEGRLDITDSERANLLKLTSNRIDVSVNNVLSTYWYAKKLGILDKIKVLDFTIKRGDYFVTFAKASKRLSKVQAQRFLSAIDGCVRILKKNKDYDVLRERYGVDDNK